MDFRLRKFVPSTIKKNIITIIGVRAAGKTVLVKDLLQHTDFSHIELIKTNEKIREEYSGIVPHENIHDEYSDAVVHDFVDKQMKQKKAYDEESATGVSVNNPHACIIFEDCLFDGSWTRDSGMRKIFCNNRALYSTVVMVMQYPEQLHPIFRTQFDRIFLFKTPQQSARKRLFQDYGTMFPTYEAFCQVFEQITNDPFTCMIIDNTSQSTRLEDRVFWYKIPQE